MGYLFSAVVGICPGVELLDQVVTLCFPVRGTVTLISTTFRFHQPCVRPLVSPHRHQHWLLPDFLPVAFLSGCLVVSVVVLI